MIYFAEAKDLNLIKIGYSKDPEKRLILLNSNSPVKIKLLKSVKGEKIYEWKIHQKFNNLRVKGEWFKNCKELTDFINKICDFPLLNNNTEKYYKIMKISNSKGVILSSHITKRLKLDIDDLVEIDIKKVNNEKNES